MFGKESIGPSLMIRTPTPPGTATTLPKDTAQAHTYPAVERAKCAELTVFEIFKPTYCGPVDVRDNHFEA